MINHSAFKPEPDYIPGTFSIDPAVFVDDDGKAYMYIGGIWGGQLEKWQTGNLTLMQVNKILMK